MLGFCFQKQYGVSSKIRFLNHPRAIGNGKIPTLQNPKQYLRSFRKTAKRIQTT
jgi:hypothetical protein